MMTVELSTPFGILTLFLKHEKVFRISESKGGKKRRQQNIKTVVSSLSCTL